MKTTGAGYWIDYPGAREIELCERARLEQIRTATKRLFIRESTRIRRNSPMFTRKDGILTAIGVMVLLIGTATGSAYAMLGMAVAGLALSLFLIYRWNLKGNTSLIVLTVAVTAMAIGIALSAFPL